MPCDSQISTTIEWSSSTDHEALFDALKALKLNPVRASNAIRFNGGTYVISTHTLSLTGYNAETRAKEMKRMYMVCATKAQAIKRGFTIRAGKTAYDFQLVRRSI